MELVFVRHGSVFSLSKHFLWFLKVVALGSFVLPYVESQPAAPPNATVLMAMSLERPFRLIERAPIQQGWRDFKKRAFEHRGKAI